MTSERRTRTSRLAGGLLAIGLLAATPVGAVYDCCIVTSGPAFLEGFAFHVADTDDADDWADRMGFGPPGPYAAPGDPTRERTLPLGSLWWRSQPPDPFEDLDTGIGRPILIGGTRCVDAPAATGPRPHGVAAAPNGARVAIRAIAVVAWLDGLDKNYSADRANGWSARPVFDRCFDLPELGARACEARFVTGAYRFLAPIDSTGLVASWLANGPPRWLGVAFEVEDIAATERALSARGVNAILHREGADVMVRVLPETTGGPLLEFVQAGSRR